jgi:Icc protein
VRIAVTIQITLVALAACTRPAEERALTELDVGRADGDGLTVEVADGLAAVRAIAGREIVLWSQAPTLQVTLTATAAAAGPWTLRVRNALPDAELTVGGVAAPASAEPRPTDRTFAISLAEGTTTARLAPPDAATPGRYRVAAMADIQTAMPEVDDVFRRISEEPDVRFVISMGDITDRARDDEYDLFERQLEHLRVPYYTTLGNHELWADPDRYRARYGRSSFQFVYRGVAFTFADSGDAGMDPIVHDWIETWCAQARDRVHLFLTHFPPLDPIGVRAGSFRNWREAHRLLGHLADGRVDLTLYGHIHSYYAFENAGIPAYISGGGGADPERWDGIGRHFLVIDLDPVADRVSSVGVVRVDD